MQQNDTNKFRESTWSQNQQHALSRSSSNVASLCIHCIEVHEIDYEGDKKKCMPLLLAGSTDSSKKIIIYSNMREKIMNTTKQLELFLNIDNKLYLTDAISIHGQLFDSSWRRVAFQMPELTVAKYTQQ